MISGKEGRMASESLLEWQQYVCSLLCRCVKATCQGEKIYANGPGIICYTFFTIFFTISKVAFLHGHLFTNLVSLLFDLWVISTSYVPEAIMWTYLAWDVLHVSMLSFGLHNSLQIYNFYFIWAKPYLYWEAELKCEFQFAPVIRLLFEYQVALYLLGAKDWTTILQAF